jgi:membrane-bound lytic murein transglycosylase B
MKKIVFVGLIKGLLRYKSIKKVKGGSKSVFVSSHSFEKFLDQVRKTATEQGVSKSTIDKACFELTPSPSIIASEKAQAEFNQNFWHYVNKRVSKVRLNNGKDTLKNDALLLNKVSEKYGVPAYVIVAFLGLESNYGNYMGSEVRALFALWQHLPMTKDVQSSLLGS